MPLINISPTLSWKEIFALVAEQKAEDRRVKRQKEIAEEIEWRERDKKQVQETRERKEEEDAFFERVLATATQIADFSESLDTMDAATVHALMKNGEALDRVNAEIKDILDRAYVLPDGRRVFKDDKGRKVFDEQGKELPPGTIDPAIIEDWRPRVGLLLGKRDEQLQIEAQRNELHAFQSKIDEDRARIEGGHVTAKDIASMKADLEAAMPQSVRDEVKSQFGKLEIPQQNAIAATPSALNLKEALRAAVPHPTSM